MENVCRTCLRMPEKLVCLFDDVVLPQKIATIASIQITEHDGLPGHVCEECIVNINFSYNFRKVIINSDLELRERCDALKNELRYEEFPANVEFKIEGNCTEIITPPDLKIKTEYEIIENLQELKLQRKLNNCQTNEGIAHKRINSSIATKNKSKRKSFNFKNMVNYCRKKYECQPCNFSCTELSKWQNHKRTNHYALKVCNICGKSMRSDNLYKHVKSHTEEPVVCPECNRTFKNSESLRTHSFIHSGAELICYFCGKSYRLRGEYNRHIKRHNSKKVKTVSCPLCEKLFYDNKYLKKHMQTHTGERPYICGYCEKGYSSRYALKTHIRLHTNEKPYICEYCPTAFPQKVSLVAHIKSKHKPST